LYWPGDFTHPIRNPDFRPNQVYLTDRSRASTFDFIVLFCAAPSYGVGQENEIATQAGLPAIRLIPNGISRMMSGSFLCAVDVGYSGSLEDGVTFNDQTFVEALQRVRKMYFRHRALFVGMNGNGFGERLRRAVDDRIGDHLSFAADLGINLLYLDSLMKEPFAVSNPSARLLRRMSIRLGVSVGYLLGETVDSDPILTESLAAWNTWIESTEKLDARVAIKIKRDWKDEYGKSRRQTVGVASFRSINVVMRETDWDKKYQEGLRLVKGDNRAEQQGLF
jgi:transcriptional regulator with XRE-family HTH domain